MTKGMTVANASGTFGAHASSSDDGWSQARPVRAGGESYAGRTSTSHRVDADDAPSRNRPSPRVIVPPPDSATRRSTSNGAAPRPNVWDRPPAPARTTSAPARNVPAPQHAPAGALQQLRETAAADQVTERGLPGWGALLVLIAIAAIGGAIDMINGPNVRGGFNFGIIIASIVAILVVRRSGMFPVVVAPPIVYSAASGFLLYVRSGGLHDRKVLIDTAANWLVYGFPAIAAATAAVLIIAGIRMVIRR